MKLPSRVSVLLAIVAGLLEAHGAPLTSTDVMRDITPLIEHKTLQAVSVGVIQAGASTTAHAGTLAPDRPMSPDDRTLYEIGSVTKVFTSLLLAEAVVRGELTLDTPIARLLPADVVLPDDAGERITLRMLATHTAGLPNIPVEIPTDNLTNPYADYTEADLWASLRRVKLDFAPGSRATYSNLGAGLLGSLLARRAGMTYAQLLAARITKPLGMSDTVVEPNDVQRGRFAPPFASTGQQWSHWDFDALAGCGGIRSTLSDMMRFAAAMLHPEGSPLEKSIRLAWARQDLAGSVAAGGQALGWMLAEDGQTRWHGGMTGGYHAAIFANRELGVAVVLLCNRSNSIGTNIAGRLFHRAAGASDRPIPNVDRPEIALTIDQLDRCTGTFRLSEKMSIVCERRDLALFVTPTGRQPDRLYAASAGTFFSRRAPVELVFELAENGSPANAVVIKQGSRVSRALRE